MIRVFMHRRVGKGASLPWQRHSCGLLGDAPLPTLSRLASLTAWAKARRRAFAHPTFATFLALLGLVAPAFAQPAPSSPAPPRQHISIGYVEIEGDPRYEPIRAFERLVLKTRDHPFAGAQIGIDDAAALVRVLNAEFALERITVKSPAEVAPAVIAALEGRGIHFFLIDAPPDAFKPLAAAAKGRDALLFNVSAADDGLRRDLCAREFVHVIPSLAMRMDALMQYLASRKWRDILVFEGPLRGDAETVRAFTRSAQKFGAKIVADQRFKTGTDPREREQNNPALLRDRKSTRLNSS